MGKPVVYTWIAASATAVANLQTTVGAAKLILNGNLSNPNNSPFITFGNVSRLVSLTSTNNLSAVNVTITGIYKGSPQTETIAGPNNNTVNTTLLFDTVTSVTVSGAVTAISVGSGTVGQTQWFQYDIYAQNSALSAQVVVTGTIAYTFVSTIDDVTLPTNAYITTGIVIPQPNNANAYTLVMSNQATSQFANLNYPVRYASLVINSATTGSLVFTLLQQGIK